METYSAAVRPFDRFFKAHGMPSHETGITREHVGAFIADLLVKLKPATANNRYRALQAFWKWAVEEGSPSTVTT